MNVQRQLRTREERSRCPTNPGRIIALAQQELPVRAIAEEVGCSTGSVSNGCRLAGIALDRGRTRAATEARQADARAARVELAAELVALARDELARLRRPHTEYWGVGGSEPVVLSQLMPEPPPRARRELITGPWRSSTGT